MAIPVPIPAGHLEINIGMACNHACVFCMSGLTSKTPGLGLVPYATLEAELVCARADGSRSL